MHPGAPDRNYLRFHTKDNAKAQRIKAVKMLFFTGESAAINDSVNSIFDQLFPKVNDQPKI